LKKSEIVISNLIITLTLFVNLTLTVQSVLPLTIKWIVLFSEKYMLAPHKSFLSYKFTNSSILYGLIIAFV